MIDYGARGSSNSDFDVFDAIRRIEAMAGEIPYEIKQFKKQVSDFRSMGKKLTSLRDKAESRGNAKMIKKLEAFTKEYAAEYRKCRITENTIKKQIDELVGVYAQLGDYYASSGKRKEEKRIRKEADKYESSVKRQLEAVSALLVSQEEISELADVKINSFEMEKEPQRPRESRGYSEPRRQRFDEPSRDFDARGSRAERFADGDMREGARHNQEGRGYWHQPAPQDPYRMPPPMYYQPYMPAYQPAPSFNIAPISIDVNSAVDSAIASFIKMFDIR